jgi:hypothetical protein
MRSRWTFDWIFVRFFNRTSINSNAHKSDAPHVGLPAKVGRRPNEFNATITTQILALCPWLSRIRILLV